MHTFRTNLLDSETQIYVEPPLKVGRKVCMNDQGPYMLKYLEIVSETDFNEPKYVASETRVDIDIH